MAPHSSTLAWSLGVGHDWETSLSLFIFIHWRRKWQPTPAFLPGESQGWANLVGCHLWGRTRLKWLSSISSWGTPDFLSTYLEINSLSMVTDGNETFVGEFIGRTDAETETSILWPPHAKSWLIGKDSDAGRDWGQEEKGTTGWDGWMALPTQWTWVWVNSGSWWWTGRPGMLQFMGSQRVGHDWATELNWHCGVCRSLHPVHPWITWGLGVPTYQGSCSIIWPISWKILTYKWTYTVQTCIVQGSTVQSCPYETYIML